MEFNISEIHEFIVAINAEIDKPFNSRDRDIFLQDLLSKLETIQSKLINKLTKNHENCKINN